jgi:hypothetical protein
MEEGQILPFAKDHLRKREGSWTLNTLLPLKTSLLSLPIHLSFQKLLEISELQKADPYIDRFSDLILDYAVKKGSNAAGFIEWWDEFVDSKKWSVTITDDADAIRILSIHKSKGLQFPIVITPLLDWKVTPNSNDVIWAQSQVPPFDEMDYLPVSPVKGLSETYLAETFYKECQENYLDNLNLLYVAFTRAENELYAFVDKKAKTGNVNDLIVNTLQNEPAWAEQLEGAETVELHIGDVVIPSETKKDLQPAGLYSPQSRLPGFWPAQDLQKQYSNELSVRYESDEIKFGNQVHAVLYRMRTRLDISKALQQTVLKEGLLYNEEQKQQLKETVLKVWDLMEAKGWNDPEATIECEPELCDEKGLSHRPDRVVLKNDAAIVIDFKTGQPNKKHHEQVNFYGNLMKKTGSKKVEGFLVYTGSLTVEQVAID